MTTSGPVTRHFKIHPLSNERWNDFEDLFGTHGAVGGCWCMWFRLKRKEFDVRRGDRNHLLMRSIVEAGEVPGILAYDGDQAAGWCSVAPREAFPVLGRSPVLKPVDEEPVWSIVCFFIAKSHRKQGLMNVLLQAAVGYAAQQGASIVEGYPVDPAMGSTPDVFAFTGVAAAFEKAGFVEVARRSPTRPIMRYFIEQ
jgi:GNAT superfamily N-acetyltransferase